MDTYDVLLLNRSLVRVPGIRSVSVYAYVLRCVEMRVECEFRNESASEPVYYDSSVV